MAATAGAVRRCPAPAAGVRVSSPGRGRTVALTFDDGPGASTAATLRVLQRFGVTATFFDVGLRMREHPGLVRAQQRAGVLVGDHTWSHEYVSRLSARQQGREMDREIAEQRRLTGTAPCVFRPPHGAYDATTLAQARRRGMTVWNWSVSTGDWEAHGSRSRAWVQRIVTRAESGSDLRHPVILMHNGPAPTDKLPESTGDPATVAALPSIITFYRNRGYRFVDLLGRSRSR